MFDVALIDGCLPTTREGRQGRQVVWCGRLARDQDKEIVKQPSEPADLRLVYLGNLERTVLVLDDHPFFSWVVGDLHTRIYTLSMYSMNSIL